MRSLPRVYAEPWAFIAAAVSLGRVRAILAFLDALLDRLGPSWFHEGEDRLSDAAWEPLKYRFYGAHSIRSLCQAVRRIIRNQGSLEALTWGVGHPSVAMENVFDHLRKDLRSQDVAERELSHLLPSSQGAGAGKRQAMLLRWLVRSDHIDLGLWSGFHPRDLEIPVDTHILRHATTLGLTAQKQANRRAREEITTSLRTFDPQDPVKYDFSLSRIGIHPALRHISLADVDYGRQQA